MFHEIPCVKPMKARVGMLNMTDRELTLAEVAASLRVNVDTARVLLVRGDIPARKQGRQWRVLESEIEAYKQRGRAKRGEY